MCCPQKPPYSSTVISSSSSRKCNWEKQSPSVVRRPHWANESWRVCRAYRCYMLPVSRFARDINAIFANYLPSLFPLSLLSNSVNSLTYMQTRSRLATTSERRSERERRMIIIMTAKTAKQERRKMNNDPLLLQSRKPQKFTPWGLPYI